MIRLFADSVIFQKDPFGGIARLYREIWPRMCGLEPELHIILFADGPVELNIEPHPQISIRRAPPVKRSLRFTGILNPLLHPFRRIASRGWNLARGIWVGRGAGMIWHSTYFTWPEFWRGRQVVTVHDMIHERFPDLYHDRLDEIARQQKRRCVEQADAIICVSESTRMDLEYFYGAISKPVYVVPSALSEVFRLLPPDMDSVQNGTGEPFLLYVGKRSHHKNFRGFMDAYRVWEGKTEVCVIVVGKPWEREEQAYLTQAGIAERVRLMSELDDEDLCRLYNRALAFVFPSLYEGLGLPVLEAMACGCPVVASRIPTTANTAGEVPFFFDPAQPQSLVAAIDRALVQGRNPARVQEGITRARQFTWDKTARGYLEVYRALENR